MEQEKIEKYVDNLDVNTQADLLKKIIWMLNIREYDKDEYNAHWSREFEDIERQIEEFNENFTEQYTKQELKQFDGG